MSLSELLKEEIEQESLEANNTASSSYIEADAIYADGGQLIGKLLTGSTYDSYFAKEEFLGTLVRRYTVEE